MTRPERRCPWCEAETLYWDRVKATWACKDATCGWVERRPK